MFPLPLPNITCQMAAESDIPRDAIRQILLEDWDPHNASRMDEACGTYDTYIERLWTVIKTGADEEAVMHWLHEREKESMCFPSLGMERLRRVARKLLALLQDNA